MPKNTKRRSPNEKARDRRRIADLYLRGVLQCDIAAELGLSQTTISRDLSALQDEWLTAAVMDLNAAKARELARIDRLEREYWSAWERSQEDAETETVKIKGEKTKGEKEKPQSAEQVKQRKGQSGNPSFLAGIQWCIEQRCKVLGLNAPTKGSMLNIDLSQLSDDQVERIAKGDDPLVVLASTSRTGTAAARPVEGE